MHGRAVEQLCAPAQHDDEPRPKLEGHGDYVFGVFLVAVAVPEEDTVFYQEIDLVMTRDRIVTVRKAPEGRPPYDPAEAKAACRDEDDVGMVAYHFVDDRVDDEFDLLVRACAAEHDLRSAELVAPMDDRGSIRWDRPDCQARRWRLHPRLREFCRREAGAEFICKRGRRR